MARLLILAALIGATVFSTLGSVAADSTESPCGDWNGSFRPEVAPIEMQEERQINDGEVDVEQVGDVLPGRPTAIAIAPGGGVYVAVTYNTVYPLAYASALYGSIFLVDDSGSHLLIDGLPFPNGMTFAGDDLYVTVLGGVARIAGVNGTACTGVETVLDGLPFDDVHQTNGIVHHDGRLYVSQGLVYEPIPSSRTELNGTIFSFAPDGSDLRIEATGLRNPYGIAFDDQGRLWASDNGPNVDYDPGYTAEVQITPDELNLIQPGGDYGFHPEGHELVLATPAASVSASPVACADASCSTPPFATFGNHVAPAGVAWDSANGQVLTAISNQWQVQAADPDTGEIQVVLWNVSTPTALAVGPDGTLYVGEWTSQRVVAVDLADLDKVGS